MITDIKLKFILIDLEFLDQSVSNIQYHSTNWKGGSLVSRCQSLELTLYRS